MKNLVVRKLLAPLAERIGTALAAFLAGSLLADPVLVDQFVVAVSGVLLIGVDLVISHFERKRGVR